MNQTVISQTIADAGIWPLVVMLVPYVLIFRRHGAEANKKRLASLLHAIAVFLVTIGATIIMSLGLSDIYLLIPIIGIALGSYFARAQMFPYRLTCPSCGKRYNLLSDDFKIVYVMDDNLCEDCRPEEV